MEHFFAILLFCIASAFTPGPNNIMVMSSGVNFGAHRTLPHFFGICLGLPALVLLIGTGLGSVFLRFPTLHEGIKIVGALYMLYLAWRIATNKTAVKKRNTSKPFTFLQAVLFQWVNPKVWTMSISVIAAYTTPGPHLLRQIVMITLVSLMTTIPAVAMWLTFGVGLKKLLQDERNQRYFNYTMGMLLVASVFLMFLHVD